MSLTLNTTTHEPIRIIATCSRINILGNSYHQRLLINHLRQGNTINFAKAMDLGISFLNERVRVLQQEVTVYSRDIRIGNIKCKEYSLVLLP